MDISRVVNYEKDSKPPEQRSETDSVDDHLALVDASEARHVHFEVVICGPLPRLPLLVQSDLILGYDTRSGSDYVVQRRIQRFLSAGPLSPIVLKGIRSLTGWLWNQLLLLILDVVLLFVGQHRLSLSF